MSTGLEVSVIVTTRNNESTIGECLRSIRGQRNASVEVIVVDNNSSDRTPTIAKELADIFADHGPERSAQRNRGAQLASADWLFFIDSDMILEPQVVADALAAAHLADAEVVVIGEESFGEGFWARCKALERSFYLGVDWIEAPRFFSRRIFESVGGYDENLTGPEDFDLPQRIKHANPGLRIARAATLIRHNEQRLSLRRTLSKKRYYGRTVDTYASAAANTALARRQANPLARYSLFLRNPRRLFARPGVGIGMLAMKTAEFAAGGIGYAERPRKLPNAAVLVSHSTGLTGPIDYYAAFLRGADRSVTLITHPLDSYRGAHSSVSIDGSTTWSRPRQRGGPLALLFDGLVSLRWIVSTPSSLYVGANNFDTVCCLLGRTLTRRTNATVIYFASDYSETRFASAILDRLYRAAEHVALTQSDMVVSNTHRAASKRAELGLSSLRSIVIPNGVERTCAVPARKPESGSFAYVGSVTREHGLFDMVLALGPLVKRFLLIGDGDDWDRVVTLITGLGADVEIHRAKDRTFVLERLSTFSGFGLAPYNSDSRWTFYCSPLKVVEYVASGLPVVVSDVPEIAEDIAERGLGITYDVLDSQQLARKLDTFDADTFSRSAEAFVADYDSDRLYRRILT